MSVTLPTFTPAQESLWLTLCGRALDNRLPEPFLGDVMADEIVTKIGYDLGKFPLPKSKIFDIAMRAKAIDSAVRSFVAAHANAVVLDLGAGLDVRTSRVDPAETVDWYDIDFPEVMEVRRQVVPDREGVRSLAANLTATAWLEGVPRDRPAVIVADGLVPFLTQEELSSLFSRIIAHFPYGELALNGYPTFAVWVVKHLPRMFDSISADVVNPGFDDPRDLELWVPGLTLTEEIFPARGPETARLSRATRMLGLLLTKLLSPSPRWTRSLATTVLRYRFSGGVGQEVDEGA